MKFRKITALLLLLALIAPLTSHAVTISNYEETAEGLQEFLMGEDPSSYWLVYQYGEIYRLNGETHCIYAVTRFSPGPTDPDLGTVLYTPDWPEPKLIALSFDTQKIYWSDPNGKIHSGNKDLFREYFSGNCPSGDDYY